MNKRNVIARNRERAGGFKRNPDPSEVAEMVHPEASPLYDIAEGFRATIMELVLKYRGKDIGLTTQFVAAVEREKARYDAKNLSPSDGAAVANIALRAINAARAGGVVAYEPGV